MTLLLQLQATELKILYKKLIQIRHKSTLNSTHPIKSKQVQNSIFCGYEMLLRTSRRPLLGAPCRWLSQSAQVGGSGAGCSGGVLQLDNRKSPADLRHSWPKSTFHVGQMKHLLDHDNHETRDRFRDFFKQALFQPRFNMTLEEERELALKRLKVIS